MEHELPEHDEWMELALAEARRAAAGDEVPIGAVLVHEGQVIGRGYNRREHSGRTCGHAEILALEDFNQNFGQWRLPPRTSLYVTAEPCLMCTGALIWGRVDRIFFGCPDPKDAGLRSLLGRIDAGDFDHRFEQVVGGIGRLASASLLRSFFQDKRDQSRIERQLFRSLTGVSHPWTAQETQEFPLLPI